MSKLALGMILAQQALAERIIVCPTSNGNISPTSTDDLIRAQENAGCTTYLTDKGTKDKYSFTYTPTSGEATQIDVEAAKLGSVYNGVAVVAPRHNDAPTVVYGSIEDGHFAPQGRSKNEFTPFVVNPFSAEYPIFDLQSEANYDTSSPPKFSPFSVFSNAVFKNYAVRMGEDPTGAFATRKCSMAGSDKQTECFNDILGWSQRTLFSDSDVPEGYTTYAVAHTELVDQKKRSVAITQALGPKAPLVAVVSVVLPKSDSNTPTFTLYKADGKTEIATTSESAVYTGQARMVTLAGAVDPKAEIIVKVTAKGHPMDGKTQKLTMPPTATEGYVVARVAFNSAEDIHVEPTPTLVAPQGKPSDKQAVLVTIQAPTQKATGEEDRFFSVATLDSTVTLKGDVAATFVKDPQIGPMQPVVVLHKAAVEEGLGPLQIIGTEAIESNQEDEAYIVMLPGESEGSFYMEEGTHNLFSERANLERAQNIKCKGVDVTKDEKCKIPENDDPQPEEDGFNWTPVIIGVVAVGVIGAAGGYFFMNKKKAQEAPLLATRV